MTLRSSRKENSKEKIKADMNDYLMWKNSCGIINYATYLEMYDFTMKLLGKMYVQGLKDGKH